ncbi:glutamine synthetase [Nocardioides sp. GY 10127]|nr:glutamine synthetase [Nocardioides sp. GY 10127]
MGASPSWSVFCVDSGIAFTPELGVVGDLRIRVDPTQARPVEDGVAWAPGEFYEQDGTPSSMCTRGALARQAARAADLGLSVLVGAELECTVLAPDGSHSTTSPWSPYSVRTSLAHAGLLREVTARFAAAGLPIEQLHDEYGHDQLELSLPPLPPVEAADAVVLARILLSRAAESQGLRISFSPVPFAGEAGNGAHLHLSLADEEGPLLAGGDGPHGMREAGQHAVAGLVDSLPELLALHAGSVLSPVRLQPGNWAGAAACWGLENREAAVRLLGATQGNPHGANVELKVVDPSTNPYLAVATMLGAALDGIEEKTELPAEVTDAPDGATLPPLPTTQRDALAALDGSARARRLLGDGIVGGVLAVRTYEADTFGERPVADVAEALRLAWTC